MKVHYVTMAFPVPSETFATNEVRALRNKGIDPSVHCLLPPHEDSRNLLRQRGLMKLRITHGGIWRYARGVRTALLRPRLTVQLATYLLRHCTGSAIEFLKSLLLAPSVLDVYHQIEVDQPEVVHLYWGHYPSLVGHLVQENSRSIVVSVSLGAYDLEARYGGTGPVARRAELVRTLGKVNIPRIHESFGVPKDCVTVIHDAVDMSHLPESVRTSQQSKQASSDSKRFVTAGRLKEHKGVLDVLHVFREVVRSHPDATLTVLGDGPERPNLERACENWNIEKSVHFHGHVEHSEVFQAMASSQFFLLLSRGYGERLPNVVKEAMACGCVCIATNTPGMEELIPSRSHGRIVPLDHPRTATQEILDLLADRESLQEISEKGRAHILAKFDLSVSAQQYVDHWERLVDAKRKLLSPYIDPSASTQTESFQQEGSS